MSDETSPPAGEAQGPTPSTASEGEWDGASASGAGSDDRSASGVGLGKTVPAVGADRPTTSGAGPEKADAVGETAADGRGERGSWASPAADGALEPTASAEDVPFAPSETLVAHDPQSWPPPSVHDQRTVTSMPGADGTTPGDDGTTSAQGGTSPTPAASQPWANPFAPPGRPSAPADAAGNSFAPPSGPAASGATDPFGTPETLGSGPAADPFAPPNPGPPVNPFAPPTGPMPHARSAQHGHVPPPPIAPDGPGQVPYGYPGGGYGYPGGAHGPAAGAGAYGHPGAAPQGYYGWPGMQPLPSNGMGTAGLVLGVLAALVFCLWPLAIVLGILGVIFGAIGRGKARRGVATNPGQALAGIICGAAGIALGIGMIVVLIAT